MFDYIKRKLKLHSVRLFNCNNEKNYIFLIPTSVLSLFNGGARIFPDGGSQLSYRGSLMCVKFVKKKLRFICERSKLNVFLSDREMHAPCSDFSWICDIAFTTCFNFLLCKIYVNKIYCILKVTHKRLVFVKTRFWNLDLNLKW